MSENNIKGIMDVTMEKMRAMVDADTIIGTPLVTDGITLIPVSKVTFGLASGGSDFPSRSQTGLFGGGGGAGVSIAPVAFIAIREGEIKMLPIYNDLGAAEKAINMAPELLDKVKSLFTKEKSEQITSEQ